MTPSVGLLGIPLACGEELGIGRDKPQDFWALYKHGDFTIKDFGKLGIQASTNGQRSRRAKSQGDIYGYSWIILGYST